MTYFKKNSAQLSICRLSAAQGGISLPAAQEERDAARAARGETDESESEDKKPRKQQSRRNNRDKTEAVKEEQNESSSEKALEVVTPDADNDSVTVEGDAEQPKRRRKAPARKSEEDSETVDAAE